MVAVFQPHRYSRTEAVWEEFEAAFDDADLLVLTDIYPSGEAPRPGITGELIVEAVRRGDGYPEIIYHQDRATLPEALAELLQAGDLCLTLGAGDLVNIPEEVKPILEARAETR